MQKRILCAAAQDFGECGCRGDYVAASAVSFCDATAHERITGSELHETLRVKNQRAAYSSS